MFNTPKTNNINTNQKEIDSDSQLNYFLFSGNSGKNSKYYFNSEKDYNEFKSFNNGVTIKRRRSVEIPKIKEPKLIKIISEHQTGMWPELTDKAIDDIKKMKDCKWKLDIILNEKINNLEQKIKEEKAEYIKKEKEISGTNMFKKKIKDLKDLIKKEEEQKHSNEQETNEELKQKKKYLEDRIKQIEQNKKNLKDTMITKYKTMLELKEKLKNSINELLLIQQQIRSRKFALEQEEELKREPMEKKDPQEQEIFHLSQNIGQYINDNLLIKNNFYK